VLVAVGLNQKGADVTVRKLLAASGDALAELASPAAVLALGHALASRAGRALPPLDRRAERAFEHPVSVAASSSRTSRCRGRSRTSPRDAPLQ
jgi:hypothetical protein